VNAGSSELHAGRESARLFLALWPGPATREGLADWRDAWRWPGHAVPVRPEKLHMTLHFIGNMPRDRIAELMQGLAVPFAGFDLSFGRAALWPHGLAVLHPVSVPTRLLQLHGALREALQRLQLTTEERAFRAHVTLARRAAGAAPPVEGPALRWRVRSYELMESRLGADGGYRVLQLYA
jgi:RNA 2',3'-cyclic 3'-phosphodiesterase